MKIRKFSMIQWILIALIMGAITGAAVGPAAVNLKWIGTIFINMIMMIIAPLVFFSIVSGIIMMGDPKKLGRIGLKTFIFFVFTTGLAIVVSVALTLWIEPGVGMPEGVMENVAELSISGPKALEAKPSVLDILMGVVPNNALKAMMERNILQVIFFAVMVGIVIIMFQEKLPRMIELIHEAAEICYGIIGIVIRIAPLAVFALTAWSVGVLGMETVQALAMLVVVVLIACLLQYVIFALAVLLSGLNPIPFVKKALEFQLIAFSTSSSTATMPTTIKIATKELGVSDSTASLVIPLGATINMNGTAIYLAACTVFVAQLNGITFGISEYSIILTTIVLLSIGTAAVPSGSIIMMPVVFASVGLPVEAIGLILGVDRILDMVRTTLNVTGDATTAVIIERSEGGLNSDVYYAKSE